MARMPRQASPLVDDYLGVLEMAMLDGFLAEHEKDSLVQTADALGLTRQQVLDVHAIYLQTMASIAWNDGRVTAAEHEEMVRAALMLGLTESDVQHALRATRTDPQRAQATATRVTSGLALAPGNRVVFTGDMRRPRREWENLVTAAGLTLGGVTKSTTLVVAADPNSLSGKAAKARSYGVPIITESAFEQVFLEYSTNLTQRSG